MTKRKLSICLAFVLLLGTLAGCSKNKTKTDNSSQNTQQETIPELASQYAYQPQYFDLPEPIQWISRSCVSSSTLYFTASILSGQDTYIDKDGNEVSYGNMERKEPMLAPRLGANIGSSFAGDWNQERRRNPSRYFIECFRSRPYRQCIGGSHTIYCTGSSTAMVVPFSELFSTQI